MTVQPTRQVTLGTALRTEVRLTVVDPARTGSRADLVVAAEPGASLASVTAELLAAVGRTVPDNGRQAVIFSSEGVDVPGSAVLGSAPLLDGVLLRVSGATAEPRPEPGLLAAHVVAGPDAGRVVSLPPGTHRIGRSPECSVRLDDADVSRLHAVLQVDAGGSTLHDAGSTHGSFVAGERAGAHPVPLGAGVPLRVGASRLLLRPPQVTPASLTPDGAGHLLVNRRPRLAAAPRETEVDFPAEPADRPPATLPWLVMLLPMAVSLVVAAVLKQPLFLLFALTTPALMAGQYLSERRASRRQGRERQAGYERDLAAAQARLTEALRADLEHEERRLPDLALLAATAQLPGADLWHRRTGDPDDLQVRLGLGPGPSRVLRRDEGSARGSGRTVRVEHEDVPIGLDLLAQGVVGICGPGRAALACSLLGQLATLHSPHDATVRVLGDRHGMDGPWSWLRWLPHHAADKGSGSAAVGSGVRVTLLDGAERLRRTPEVAAVLDAAGRHDPPRTGRDVVLCLAEDAARLPMECTATVELLPPDAPGRQGRTGNPGDGARAVLRRRGAEPSEFAADLPGPAWGELLARALAPLRDATPRPGSVPGCPALPDLLAAVDGVRVDDPHDLARHWRRASGDPAGTVSGRVTGPTATIGIGPAGPVRIDLRRDGPHALIGGTTGAGKSELLLSLVTALAADRGPDEMTFLLVDYKGGAAFRACSGLPHVVGLITDLDPHLASRALASLQAELRRRERLLAAAGVADVDAYATARRPVQPARPAMPRLVVVVDEFRVLTEELPDFVAGLVRVAAVGRSLGVHLVLATQRPSGVVSPEIRANAALRIALRVRDAADSHDLIEVTDAAAIPASAPGRAIARVGGELTGFQVASVLAVRRRPGPPSVRPMGPVDASPTHQPAVGAGQEAPAEAAEVAEAMCAAADLLGLPAPQRPWLPPLGHHIPLLPLLERVATEQGGERSGAAAVLGLADLPERQAQQPVGWSPVAGHLGILGGPRSGRTTALLTVAHALAAGHRSDQLHLYAVDAGGQNTTSNTSPAGGLSRLAVLPHCGAVVPAADADRCARLLAHLRDVIDGRRPGTAGAVVLLVDGWESVSARWSGVDHGALIDQFTAVLRDGAERGIHVALAGGRSLLTGQLSSMLSQRLVLRFADPTDAVLAGVRQLGHQPPGRGVLLRPDDPDGSETQVAVPDFAIAPDRPGTTGGPWQLRALPSQVPYHRLAGTRPAQDPAQNPEQDPLRVPVGIGGDAADVVQLNLDRPGVTLIHGSPGSGRTSALAMIEVGLRASGVGVIRLGGPAGGGDPDACRRLLEADADPDAVVLVDDVARLTDPMLEQVLVDRVRARPDRPRTVVVAGPGEVVTAFRGLAAEARTSRSGVVLGALSPADAGVLGLGPMHRPPVPPGRGRLVDGADDVAVQLALPPASPGDRISARAVAAQHA